MASPQRVRIIVCSAGALTRWCGLAEPLPPVTPNQLSNTAPVLCGQLHSLADCGRAVQTRIAKMMVNCWRMLGHRCANQFHSGCARDRVGRFLGRAAPAAVPSAQALRAAVLIKSNKLALG